MRYTCGRAINPFRTRIVSPPHNSVKGFAEVLCVRAIIFRVRYIIFIILCGAYTRDILIIGVLRGGVVFFRFFFFLSFPPSAVVCLFARTRKSLSANRSPPSRRCEIFHWQVPKFSGRFGRGAVGGGGGCCNAAELSCRKPRRWGREGCTHHII